MAKYGSWKVQMTVELNGKEVDFFSLSSHSRSEVLAKISQGYEAGTLIEKESPDEPAVNRLVYRMETADGQYGTFTDPFDDYAPMDVLFGAAARMIAFDDIDPREILEIVYRGESYEYAGWMPGMHMAFYKVGADRKEEPAWEAWFPEWDH